MSRPSSSRQGERDTGSAGHVPQDGQQPRAACNGPSAVCSTDIPGVAFAHVDSAPSAWFVLEGRQCAVVPCDGAPPCGLEVLGTLALGRRNYLVIGLSFVPEPGMLDRLSPRELEIALLVAEGQDAKAIARRLRISFYTVRVHLGRIYCKLGLHKQTELTACVAARYCSLRLKAEVGPSHDWGS